MESGTLKTVLFALCAALVILIFMPKDCAKQAAHPIAALKKAKDAKPKELQIESSTPPPNSRAVAWPAGLDAAQLQYMIEIDARFAAPKTMFCPKQERPGTTVGTATRRLVDALLSLNYLEKRPDGSYAFTNEGLLHMTATDEGTSWSIPVAKRQYVRTDAIECPAADQCNVGFTWQWQPNEIGQAMKPEIVPHAGAAKIVGGPSGWVLSDVSQLEADL